MPKQPASGERMNKGTLLELRVARLLFAENMSPFINVYFPRPLEPLSVSTPDIDVMGCRILPDANFIYSHYDCKSGESEVVGRILLLSGMKDRIPHGHISYVRRHANLDTKLYALQHGIRLISIAQLNQLEETFVLPLFGEHFPSISDPRPHSLWQNIRRSNRTTAAKILRYFDTEFWTEEPFTRFRRTVAAIQSTNAACSEIGVDEDDLSMLMGCIIRRFIYALLTCVSKVASFSDLEMEKMAAEWLVTEKLTIRDYDNLVDSVAQYVFKMYGDPEKGPLQKRDYDVSAPEYTAQLIALLRRTVQLRDSLPWALTVFDAFAIESGVLMRPQLGNTLLRSITTRELDAVGRWYRAVRLFLCDREPQLREWPGWRRLVGPSNESKAELRRNWITHYYDIANEQLSLLLEDANRKDIHVKDTDQIPSITDHTENSFKGKNDDTASNTETNLDVPVAENSRVERNAETLKEE